MRLFGPAAIIVVALTGCGGSSPRDFTCADVVASSDKTEQLAREVVRGAGLDATAAKLATAAERANEACGPGGGSKADDKPYAKLVSLLKLERHLDETSDAEPDQRTAQEHANDQAGDLLARMNRLPRTVERYCAEVVGKGAPAPNFRDAVVAAIAALRQWSKTSPDRALASRALRAFDKWDGKCDPALRQRVIDASTGG